MADTAVNTTSSFADAFDNVADAETKRQEELLMVVKEAERKKIEEDEDFAFSVMLRQSAEEVEVVNARKYVSEHDEELAFKMMMEESRALALYSQLRNLTPTEIKPNITTLERGGSLTLYSDMGKKPLSADAKAFVPKNLPLLSPASASSTSSSAPASLASYLSSPASSLKSPPRVRYVSDISDNEEIRRGVNIIKSPEIPGGTGIVLPSRYSNTEKKDDDCPGGFVDAIKVALSNMMLSSTSSTPMVTPARSPPRIREDEKSEVVGDINTPLLATMHEKAE
jgi:hypothetical protein